VVCLWGYAQGDATASPVLMQRSHIAASFTLGNKGATALPVTSRTGYCRVRFTFVTKMTLHSSGLWTGIAVLRCALDSLKPTSIGRNVVEWGRLMGPNTHLSRTCAAEAIRQSTLDLLTTVLHT
jgi:hypothetical protein